MTRLMVGGTAGSAAGVRLRFGQLGRRRGPLGRLRRLSAAFTASSTTAWPAAASPFITFAAPSMMPIVPLIAWIGQLARRAWCPRPSR